MRDTTNRAYRATRDGAARVVGRIRRRWRTTTPQERQTVRLAAGSAALGLAVALTAVAVTGPWDSGQRTAERTWAAREGQGSGGKHTPGQDGGRAGLTAPQVLAAAGPAQGRGGSGGKGGTGNGAARDDASQRADQVPPPTSSALADTLEPLLKDGSLGSVRRASVVDVVTGRQIFSERASEPSTPASTVKLATAVAALTAAGEGHRVATRVVADGDKVTLVGGGDPTLTADDLAGLARDTAGALKKRGIDKVTLSYDTSLYSGTDQHPIGPNENLAPVTPLMLNEGRLAGTSRTGSGGEAEHGPAPRTDDPAGQAVEAFGKRLAGEGVRIRGTATAREAPGAAEQVAVHRSATLGALVERMLTHSDNDIAEALARQTALAQGEPASFDGAGRAVERVLRRLDLPLKGAHFADGSGLDRDDRVSAGLLTQLLSRAADPGKPALRPVLTGLPVAGFTGTLGGRYGGERGEPGAGLVRAKTGTLTGVNTLAGTVVDADGRMLAFAFMTTGTQERDAAQGVLDRLASALANCGCRDSPSAG
ncbi:D-alanyl-D-alanine carboxypeptidase/D-alanyl-D-alanine endopeptidase [Streptomyces iconiensis]|uniref:D-alanyl-D-alanine carboxypeptidase/D-alanyl-D-alanine endopeptidase n=1 Tax=Streptomyces iconiensis TaxID=1384038 RepID=UPI003D2F55D5